MANPFASNLLTPIPNNGAFYSKNPGAGQGTVRVPFVEMYLRGQSIPLLDAGNFFDQNKDLRDPLPRKPVLLLLDFRYVLTGTNGYGNDVSLTILDPQGDYLMALLINANSDNAAFTLRFGWRGIDDQVGGRFPELFVTGVSAKQDTGFEGVQWEIRAVDAGYALFTQEVSHAFDPRAAISDVITEVLERTSDRYSPEVESITTPVGNGHNRMENVTPFAYIESLLQVASGGPGATSDYRTVFKSGSFGKTRIIITSDKINDGITRRYIFGRENQGTMLEFRPHVEGILYLAAGAAKSIARGVDPRTKKSFVRTSSQQEDSSTEQRKINETPHNPGKVYMVPWQNREHAEGFIQGMRQMMDNHTMFADAVVYGDTGLLPLDQISILALRPGSTDKVEGINDKAILFYSGIYKIERVEHLISAGTFQTQMHLYRNSSPFGAEPAISKKNVDTSVKDPGADRVVKEIL